MRRNIDLIRFILVAIVTEVDPTNLDFTESEINYHLKLLADCKLIDAFKVHEPHWYIGGLTWEGCELLELIRDDKRWRTIKRILDEINCYSFEIIKIISINQMKL